MRNKLCCPLTADALEARLAKLVEVRRVPMPGTVARLIVVAGQGVVWLDVAGTPEGELREVLADVLRVVTLGADHATLGRPVPWLRPVP